MGSAKALAAGLLAPAPADPDPDPDPDPDVSTGALAAQGCAGTDERASTAAKAPSKMRGAMVS